MIILTVRAALVAEGHHARVDGLSSLAVLFGALGVWAGVPLTDPLIGLLITATIFKIGLESGKAVFRRLLDGVDPEVISEISTLQITSAACARSQKYA